MTQSAIIFCPKCSSYFPSGMACSCRYQRPTLQIPAAPGEPFWETDVQGSVAGRPSLTRLAEQSVLVVPWYHQPRRGDGRPPNGGVSLLRVADGSLIWSVTLGTPVEGGVGLTGDAVIVGMGTRGIGAGSGWVLALSLQDGAELWRVQLGGAVRCAPVVEKVKVYVPANNGILYCLDVRNGQEVWKTVISNEETQIPAAPLIVKEKDVVQAIVVSTYGKIQNGSEGRLIAFDDRGRRLWEKEAGGNVRGTPVIAGGRIYVPAFRSNPSAGVLSVFDARTGRPIWPIPFIIQGQPGERVIHNFSSSPLIQAGKVYIGSLNGRFFALTAETGEKVWETGIGSGIASTAVWSEGLVFFGANDGHVHALDGATGQKAWDYALEAPVLSDLLAEDGVIFAGTDNGMLAAFPWHLGQYDWAAERLEKEPDHLVEAGDCRALAGHFSLNLQNQMLGYQKAEEDWSQAGEPEKAASLWMGIDRRDLAAETYKSAGYRWRMHDRERAAGYFRDAARIYFSIRSRVGLNDCTRALAMSLQLPYIQLQSVNVGSFIQWEQGELTLRLSNEGSGPVLGGVRLWLGGALKSTVQLEIKSSLEPAREWNIPMNIVPTRRDSSLEVEIEYDSGLADFTPLRGMLSIPIEAVEPRQNVIIGDVANLQLTIAGSTQEGLAIVTRDVGSMRSAGNIGSIQTGGDVGAIMSGGGIDSVRTGGDVGLIKNQK